jgi:hypothetical protein
MSEAAVKDLIQQAIDQDFNSANKTFGDVMTVKLSDIMDQEKVRLADQIYNGIEDEDDDDQLELELEDDEEETETESDSEESEEDLPESGDDVEVGVDSEEGEESEE